MAIVSEDRLLAFCRPGDESWTALETLHLRYVSFDDVIYYRGLFYAIDFQGVVIACDVSGEPKVTLTIPCFRRHLGFTKRYLVESAYGDLLVIYQRIILEQPDEHQLSDSKNRYRKGYHTVGFRVAKLDLEAKKSILFRNMSSHQFFFLGNGESISLSARQLPGWRGNIIYFVDDNGRDGCHDMGVFNFEDSSIQPFSLNNSSWFDPLIWVTQNP